MAGFSCIPISLSLVPWGVGESSPRDVVSIQLRAVLQRRGQLGHRSRQLWREVICTNARWASYNKKPKGLENGRWCTIQVPPPPVRWGGEEGEHSLPEQDLLLGPHPGPSGRCPRSSKRPVGTPPGKYQNPQPSHTCSPGMPRHQVCHQKELTLRQWASPLQRPG